MATTTPSHPLVGDSLFEMVDIGDKKTTRRRAVAQGSILLSQDAFLALRDGKNPKGNVLALAEAAGIMAAKKMSELIPLCHPLPLNYVNIKFELLPDEFRVIVFCEAGTTAQTGVEMEALAGVNGALLTIYDLSKAVNPVLTLSDIRLNVKEGGKSGRWVHPDYQSEIPFQSEESSKSLLNIRTGVITISDRVTQKKAEDRSGALLVDLLKIKGAKICSHLTVPDEIEKIQQAALDLIRNEKAHFVVTTGGTGIGPRDITPEALEKISQRLIPGFGEVLRQQGSLYTKTAWLSRSMGYIIQGSLVIALPGSSNAVREGMSILEPLIPHALHVLNGGNHDPLH